MTWCPGTPSHRVSDRLWFEVSPEGWDIAVTVLLGLQPPGPLHLSREEPALSPHASPGLACP